MHKVKVDNKKSCITYYLVIGVLFFIAANLCGWWTASASTKDYSKVGFSKHYSQRNTGKYTDDDGKSQGGNYRVDTDGDGHLDWNMRLGMLDHDAFFTRFYNPIVQKIDINNNLIEQPVYMVDLIDRDEAEGRFDYKNGCNLEEDIEIGYGNIQEDKNGGDYVFCGEKCRHKEIYNLDLAINNNNNDTNLKLSYNCDNLKGISCGLQFGTGFGVYAIDKDGNEIRIGNEIKNVNSHDIRAGTRVCSDNIEIDDAAIINAYNDASLKTKVENPTSIFDLAKKSADEGGVIIRLDSMVLCSP